MPQPRVFTDSIQPDFGLPWPRYELKDYSTWTDDQIREELRVKVLLEGNAAIDPNQFGWTLESWREVMEQWKNYTTFCVFGGNRCVRGDTLIFDPVTRCSTRIDEIRGESHVYAFDGEKTVIAKASQPFTKTAGEMVRVVLSTGDSFVAAKEHLVLMGSGTWISCGELLPEYALYLPASISDNGPSSHAPDARRCFEIEQDSQGGYRPALRSHDESLRWAEDNGQGVFPLRAYVPTHSFAFGKMRRSLWRLYGRLSEGTLGDSVQTPLDNLGGSAPSRLSISDDLRRLAARSVGTQYRVFCRPYKSASRSHGRQETQRVGRQSTAESCPPQSTPEFSQSDNQCYGVAYVAKIEQVGMAVKWDMTVPSQGNYIAAGVIHHNSSKSVFCARLMTHLLLTIPEARLRMFHVTDEKSIAEQQQLIYECLPDRFKTLSKRKGINHSVVFSQKSGFTGNKLILPPHPGYARGSEMVFGTYSQFLTNPQIVEGWWAHAVACDEEMPQKMYERLLTRLYDVRGRMLMSFTTIAGWTPLVADILGRTKTIKKRPAPLLGGKMIPVMQESISRPSTLITYFWTSDNPFIPSDATDKLIGRPEEEIKSVAYGIPTKPALSGFPRFDELIHVKPHAEMPWLVETKENWEPPEFTRYHIIDLSGSKPWFMLWAAVDALKRVWIYREYPDSSLGAWGEPGTSLEGKKGPAHKPNGFGYKDYVEAIKFPEKGEEIFLRLVDPRLGASTKQGDEGSTNIITEFTDAMMEAGDHVPIQPAPGLHIDHGKKMIDDYLSYDASKPITALNSPRLFVSDACTNLIDALKNYTGQGGPDEVWKDPIDCLRMLLTEGADFISKSDLRSSGGVGVPY